MAWRYITRFFEADDVLDPRDWNVNMEAYAGEMNGLLDGDNLRNAIIDETHLANTAVDYPEATVKTDTGTAIDPSAPSWQDVLTKDLSTDVEEAVECEFSIQVDTATLPASGADKHLWQIRLTLGGQVVAESGPVSLAFTEANAYICGGVFITTGSSNLRGQIRFFTENLGTGVNPDWPTTTLGHGFLSGVRRRR